MASKVNDTISKSVMRGSADEQYHYFTQDNKRQRVVAYEYEQYRRKIAKQTHEAELEDLKREGKLSKEQIEELYELKKRNNERANAEILEFEKRRFELASSYDKKRIEDDRIARLRAEKEESDVRLSTLSILYGEKGKLNREEIDRINKERQLNIEATDELYNLEKEQKKRLRELSKKGSKEERKEALKQIQDITAQNKKKLAELRKIKEEDLTDEQKAEIEHLKELQGIKSNGSWKDKFQDGYEYGKDLAKSITGAIEKAVSQSLDEIQNTIDSFYASQGSIEARLQGSGSSYRQMTRIVSEGIGLSGYVSQKKVLENIKTLVDAGIAYNVEQRAFLQTISENIASTFDAANGTLLRLIRIQQADSTQARLGMEAYLTRFLNSMYSDTSYLNDLYDSVSSSIIDANAIMTRDQSVAFEYAIQKWLGSFASLGVSEQAITNIATGINYLATGNVQALSSNQGLQTLLAMSASRAGISYGSMMNTGLSAEDTNDLLEAMVEYLQEIASNQSNVVKSAYGGMFGLSLADLRAISTLTGSEISNIYGSTMTYQGATNELQNQINQISGRVHASTIMRTVYENYISSVASDIGSSEGKYLTWMIADLLEKTVGGIPLPTVSVFGSSVDLKSSVAQLMKLGLVGYSTIDQIGTLMESVRRGGNIDLTKFGGSEYLRTEKRGQGFVGIAKGAQRTESLSSSIGSGLDESDVNSMVEASTQKAKESVKSEEPQYIKDIWDALMSVIGEDSNKAMRVTIVDSELPVSVRNWDEKPLWYNGQSD